VDFVKIDVEKFECKALSAAGKFIAKYRPKAIFIEVVPQNLACMQSWMGKFDYDMNRYFGYYNYLYISKTPVNISLS
jgi:hypothetical protein